MKFTTKLSKIIIITSSYSLVPIMIFLSQLKNFSCKEIHRVFWENSVFWIIVFILSLISFIALLFWLHQLKNTTKSPNNKVISFQNIQNQDFEILNHFVTYIVPLLTLNPNKCPSIVLNMLLFGIELSMLVSNNSLQYNILLTLLKYHIYIIDDDNILISKKNLDYFKLNDVSAIQFQTTKFYYA